MKKGTAYIVCIIFALFAFPALATTTASSPDLSALQQAYSLIEKAAAGDETVRKDIADFVYKLVYPQGGDCCDLHPTASLFTHALAPTPEYGKTYILGVPSADSGSYNYIYDVIAARKSAGKIEIWPLEYDSSYDFYNKKIVKSEGSRGFRNFNFDFKSGDFTMSDIGDSMGRCITISYFEFNGKKLEITKATQTDDCVEKPTTAETEPKTIVLYAKNNKPTPPSKEKRCGWFVNPTPANATLIDKDGEWIIAVQGGHQAEGDGPDFADAQWVKTNVNYGYGCACLLIESNKKSMVVLNIISAEAKALSVCRQDKSLIEPKQP